MKATGKRCTSQFKWPINVKKIRMERGEYISYEMATNQRQNYATRNVYDLKIYLKESALVDVQMENRTRIRGARGAKARLCMAALKLSQPSTVRCTTYADEAKCTENTQTYTHLKSITNQIITNELYILTRASEWSNRPIKIRNTT